MRTQTGTGKQTPTPTDADEVVQAQELVQRLTDERQTAIDALAGLRADLAEIEGTIGDQLLDAKLADPTDTQTATTLADRLTAARAAVLSGEQLEKAVGLRIEQAEKGVLAAQAGELREQAATLFKAVKKRIEKAASMLDALEEFEGVKWMPFPWIHDGGLFLVNSWARTKTGDAIADIADIEVRAARMEVRAGVTSPESILKGVPLVPLLLGNPGQQMGPEPQRIEQDYEKRARLLDQKPGLFGYRS